jgi:REP element-mobilizing transposase RayT
VSHSLSSIYVHYVFSTIERLPLIIPEIRDRLWAYMGGIAREHKMCPVTIGGMADHGHLLIELPSTLSVAKGVQLIKAGSSKWLHETFPSQQHFAWQEGYGAFSLSKSSLPSAIEYIAKQEEHHRIHTYKEEFLAFLARYEIEYDERYLWD